MKIGLFLNNLDEEYQISVFRGIERKAKELSMDLVCIQKDTLHLDQYNSDDVLPSRSYLSVDGILLLSSVIVDHVEIPYLPDLKKLFGSIPVVSVGNRITGLPSIIIKNRASMEVLMKHLILDHKYRNFMFIGGPKDHQDNIVREHIFRRTINTYKAEYPEIQAVVRNGGFHEYSGMAITAKYIEENAHKPLDVIVAANDNMAVGALKTLHTVDNPLWKNCAITGFDDVPQAKLEIPPLTTVHQPIDELGAIAVSALHRILREEPCDPVIRIESYVCLRNSCGCTAESSALPYVPGSAAYVQNEQEPFAAEREKLMRIQYNAIKSEKSLRSVSSFGQIVNSVNSLDDLTRAVDDFLEQMNIPFFYLILFPSPTRILPNEGRLVYKKTPTSKRIYTSKVKNVCISDIIFDKDKNSRKKTSSRIINYLQSSKERTGMCIYESDISAHPHMCSMAIFITYAVKRLQMLEEEKLRSRQLEIEVARRTRDLVETNKKLREESKRRIEVEAEVLKISETERMRFSLDLHDDICQRLAGISMMCKGMTYSIPQMKELSVLIDETLHRTRQYAHEVFPMEIDSLGFKDAVGTLCHTVEKQTAVECRYSWTAQEPVPLTRERAINSYRIIQEALTNAVKHAKASRIEVTASTENSQFVLRITDNGIGIPDIQNAARTARGGQHPAKISSRSGSRADKNSRSPDKQRPVSGLGLRSMQYRADQINASFIITSSEKEGTCIELRMK